MKKIFRILLIVIASIFAISLFAIDRSTIIDQPLNEDELIVEDWMTHPFCVDDTAFYEAELEIEDWMTHPMG